MIDLYPDEKILMVLRRHWFILVGPAVLLIFLLILPSITISFVFYFNPEITRNPAVQPVLYFFLCLYILALLLYIFVFWAAYYLDIWIITTKRLIDIDQKGLFNRIISEMLMKNIQNVTVEVNGVIPTILKFGNLKVETASEESFVIKNAPDLYEAKTLILQYSNHRTEEEEKENFSQKNFPS